jgi:hypothetical protein
MLKIVVLATYYVLLAIIFVLLPHQVYSQSPGLKVIVHSNESGSICVDSFSEDLGCRYVGAPSESVFEFSPGVVEDNEEITVCLNDYCKNPRNGPEKEPIDVYFENDEAGVSDFAAVNKENDGNTNAPDNNAIIVFLAVVFVGLLIVLKLRGRKHHRREHFPTYMKKEILKKQGYKCAICKKSAGVWDFDHLDGNRSNNDVSNCQALCPNCHAKKTRGLIVYEKPKFPLKKYFALGFFLLIVVVYFIFL